MKKRKLKLKKLNNRGMSLVEVLVAMVILSVTGVAFLQSFSYAVRYNTLAKEKQQALTYAQSMMETSKAYSISELDDGKYKVFNVPLKNSANVDNYVRTIDTDTDTHTYEIHEIDGKYTVTMTAVPSTTDGVGAVVSKDIAMLHNPSAKTDALYVEDIGDTTGDMVDLLSEIWTNVLATSGDDELNAYLSSEVGDALSLELEYITITSRSFEIIADVEAGLDAVNVVTTYNYKVDDYPYTVVAPDGTTEDRTYSTTGVVTMTTTGCFQSSLGGSLENIYFYYYPLYKDMSSFTSTNWIACDSDEIVINNKIADREINVYLYKQRLPGHNATEQSTFNENVKTLENWYCMNVKRADSMPASAAVHVYHNLDSSLHGLTPSNPLVNVVSGFRDESDPDDPEKSTFNTGMVVMKEAEPLVYTVTVTVSNDQGVLFTLNGSTNAR